jgi:glycine oxidase
MIKSGFWDVVVLGGGISAYSAAFFFQLKGLRTILIQKRGGQGASGLPGGLANPAYGREAKKAWEADRCLQSLSEIAEMTKPGTASPSVLKKGIIRPAAGSDQAAMFRASMQKHSWPDGSAEWLTSEQVRDQFPLVSADHGALWLPGGLTVDAAGLINDIRSYLISAGSDICEAEDIQVQDDINNHQVLFGGMEIQSPVVVCAPGPGIAEYPQWVHLQFNRVKGQVISAEMAEEIDPGCSIAASGYAAFTGKRTVVIGSTYEHHFADVSPSAEAGSKLISRFAKMCPPAAEKIIGIRHWAGIRLTTPDRKPYAGRHWKISGFYCIAGMGSRGLLMAPYTARLLADYITENKPLPGDIDINRYYQTRKFRDNHKLTASDQ